MPRKRSSVWVKAFVIFVSTYIGILASTELSKMFPNVPQIAIQALGPVIGFLVVWFTFKEKAE